MDIDTAADRAPALRRRTRKRTIGVFASGGGMGKTTTALALASCWPPNETVRLVDSDPQLSKSAAFWLDGLVMPAPFEWAEAPAASAVDVADRYGPGVTIIDSPPRFESADIRELAAAVDVAIVVGSSSEVDAISETVSLIRAESVEPAAIIIGDSLREINGKDYREALEWLAGQGPQPVQVLGVIPHLPSLKRARVEGRLPVAIVRREGVLLRAALAEIIGNLEGRL